MTKLTDTKPPYSAAYSGASSYKAFGPGLMMFFSDSNTAERVAGALNGAYLLGLADAMPDDEALIERIKASKALWNKLEDLVDGVD